MERRVVRIIYILITFTLVNEMSINVLAKDNNKRRVKEKAGGFQKNICDITDRDSKVHCYCENTREPRNATKAECWVFNGGIPREDLIWQSFASQPTLQTLSFNVRVDGALSYVPTKALYYLQRLRSIYIKYGNIVEITSYSFANLTDLNELGLAQNQIQTLQKHSFAHLPNITSISLEDNNIIDIDAEAFIDLPKLQKLVLTKNNMSMIRNQTFQHTYNLLELDLNRNNIYYLNRHSFDGLANLRKLDLRRNRIHNLTEFTFAELWNLQELLLGKNDLRFLSERAFDGLSQLRKLSLDDNKLASLPAGLFEGVRGLSTLDLQSNELHTLTHDNIKPIFDNLRPHSSNLLLEGNNFVCDCRLKWMHALRNETKSQNTKESLDGVTCNVDPPIVSSAYNKMPETENKPDYNLDIFHAGITIETLNETMIVTDRNNISNQDVSNITSVVTKKGMKRNVLKIPPEKLTCPRKIVTTTEAPVIFLKDTFVPVQKEMKFRFLDLNSGQAMSNTLNYLLCSVIILWVFV